MVFFNVISYILAIIGGINWGLFGIFNFNLVYWLFGDRTAGAIILYVLIALACIWLIISPMITGRGLLLSSNKKNRQRESTATVD